MRILADASLPGLAEAFSSPFQITLYHKLEDLPDLVKNQDILLCRSTLKVNETLLKNSKLRFVATASSGIDHIDKEYLNTQKITLFNAKGSNALSVADYVLTCIAFLQKNTAFQGKKAGIIGFGAVGMQVAQHLQAIGFSFYAYDPPKALQSDFISCSLDEILACDLICIHANLHDSLPYPSRHLLDNSFFKQLKPHTAIINAARGDIIDEKALLSYPWPVFYCTDVYSKEPDVNPNIVNLATLCTPHIAGHNQEAKIQAVQDLSKQLHIANNLTIPAFKTANQTLPISSQNWQDSLLSLYNPIYETQRLKKAQDKHQTFLNLRKEHKRNAFNLWYTARL